MTSWKYLFFVGCLTQLGCGGAPMENGSAQNSVGEVPDVNQSLRYPWAVASCQSLESRTHGSCNNRQRTDLFPAGPAGYDWKLHEVLTEAIRTVPQSEELFDGDRLRPEKESEYAQKLVQHLDQQGICSIYVGGNQLYIRRQGEDYNEYLEFFHPGTRRARALGATDCQLADGIPGTVKAFSCSHAEIKDPVCTEPTNVFKEMVTQILREIIAEEMPKGEASKLFDFRFNPSWELGYIPKDDGVSLIWVVAERVAKKGYCVRHNNWKALYIRDGSAYEEVSIVSHFNPPSTQPKMAEACRAHGIDGTCERVIVRIEETCR